MLRLLFNNKQKLLMLGLLIVPISIAALDYYPESDYYTSTDWSIEVVPIANTSEFITGNLNGTHNSGASRILASVNRTIIMNTEGEDFITDPNGAITIANQAVGVIASYIPEHIEPEKYFPDEATFNIYNSNPQIIKEYSDGCIYLYNNLNNNKQLIASYTPEMHVPDKYMPNKTEFDKEYFWWDIKLNEYAKNEYMIELMNIPSDLQALISFIINVYDDQNSLVASGYLFKHQLGQNPWKNLTIFADGIDTDNMRTIIEVANNPDYNMLMLPNAEVQTPMNLGYNMCFVDFAIGDDDIRKNSKAMLKIIEYANSQTTDNIVVGGFSMGGVVARLALLYGQKLQGSQPSAQINHVKKFLTVDSPHNGAAGAPVDFQLLVEEVQPEQTKQISNPASKQLLYHHYLSPESNRSFEHDKFYSFLDDMGSFPKDMVCVAISDADFMQPYQYNSYTWNFSLTYENSILPDVELYNRAVTFDGYYIAPGSYVNVVENYMDMFSGNEIVKSKYPSAPIAPLLEPFIAAIPSVTLQSIIRSELASGYIDLSYKKPDIEPTFIPINSAFALKEDTPINLLNSSSLELLTSGNWTPFDKLYISSKRYEHIVFNNELISLMVQALNDPLKSDITPVINLLLD